jgi:hypothetical protein
MQGATALRLLADQNAGFLAEAQPWHDMHLACFPSLNPVLMEPNCFPSSSHEVLHAYLMPKTWLADASTAAAEALRREQKLVLILDMVREKTNVCALA